MDILDGLNPEQQAAVTFTGGPLLILAGAGRGKTKVLTHRTAYLIESGLVKAENVLLLTFTNKAAEEMMRRVRALLEGRNEKFKTQIQGGTFHSFCARVLRKFSLEAGLDKNFVIFDTGDQVDVVKRAMNLVGLDSKTMKPGSILGAISTAKNELLEPQQYASYARGNWQQDAARAYLVYQQLLTKYQALDFDDLLVKTVKLLKTRPEVLEALTETFQEILVDEYQDTNKAQYEITKSLTKQSHRLTVVGDAAQAIYSWRGADYRNLLLLKQDFPDLKTINLEQN
jgi:DNA helicase-2/ATP-dependent DNA helicase PcrA